MTFRLDQQHAQIDTFFAFGNVAVTDVEKFILKDHPARHLNLATVFTADKTNLVCT
jgi:hypothetical protein